MILKGGKEAARTNEALVRAITIALGRAGAPPCAVQLVAGRDEIADLLRLDEDIDLVIPRGSKALVRDIKSRTRIPVLGHADGICAVYIDSAADIALAVPVVVDSKTNYPAACNAAEVLLLHRDVCPEAATTILPALIRAGVKLHCDAEAYAVAQASPALKESLASGQIVLAPATTETVDEEDALWREWLSLDMSIVTIAGLEDAIEKINTNGSHHTDTIVTANEETARTFLASVDSAGVYHNASTRFADGFRYGFGAEVVSRTTLFGTQVTATPTHTPLLISGRQHKSHPRTGPCGTGRTAFVQVLHEGIWPDRFPVLGWQRRNC